MSSDLHRDQHVPVDPATAAPTPAASPKTTTANLVPHTRTGAAWFGVCAAALLFVVLIVFMLQNTRSVEVTFLWLHGSVPLALALLIAAVGATILAATVGAARITQLRRLARRRH
jgi:lipopolysaccharide assembly protein A